MGRCKAANLLAQAQASTCLKLLPRHQDLQGSLLVAFCSSLSEVQKAPMLAVSKQRYLRCAQIRKIVNPVIADATIDPNAVDEDLPHDGVPKSILGCAVCLPESERLRPTMDGPAKRQNLFSAGHPDEDASAEKITRATSRKNLKF